MKSEGHGSEDHVWRTRSTDATLIVLLLRHHLMTSTSDQGGPPRQMSQPAAESPVETTEAEIADKPNTDEIKVKESAALDPTKRRLELWKSSTSRNLMTHVQQNRVRSTVAEHANHRARESDMPKSHSPLTPFKRVQATRASRVGADRRFVNIHNRRPKRLTQDVGAVLRDCCVAPDSILESCTGL